MKPDKLLTHTHDLPDRLISQHNAITSARYHMGMVEKNIVYMLLSQIKKTDADTQIYQISVQELLNRTKTKTKYNEFKLATEKLIKCIYTINQPNGNLLQVGLLSSAEYKLGQGIIELEFSQKIRPFLIEIKKNFTTFSLNMALSLKSKYSKRIYEMISQYKDTTFMKITIGQLKQRLMLTENDSCKEKYQEISMFKKKVLDIAQREIQQYTELNFTYELHKTGRKFTNITFHIKNNKQKIPQLTAFQEEKKTDYKTNDQSIPSQNNTLDAKTRFLERLTHEFYLSEWQAKKIITSLSTQEIGKTIRELQILKYDGKIKNIGAFTAKTFDNKFQLGFFKDKTT